MKKSYQKICLSCLCLSCLAVSNVINLVSVAVNHLLTLEGCVDSEFGVQPCSLDSLPKGLVACGDFPCDQRSRSRKNWGPLAAKLIEPWANYLLARIANKEQPLELWPYYLNYTSKVVEKIMIESFRTSAGLSGPWGEIAMSTSLSMVNPECLVSNLRYILSSSGNVYWMFSTFSFFVQTITSIWLFNSSSTAYLLLYRGKITKVHQEIFKVHNIYR